MAKLPVTSVYTDPNHGQSDRGSMNSLLRVVARLSRQRKPKPKTLTGLNPVAVILKPEFWSLHFSGAAQLSSSPVKPHQAIFVVASHDILQNSNPVHSRNAHGGDSYADWTLTLSLKVKLACW